MQYSLKNKISCIKKILRASKKQNFLNIRPVWVSSIAPYLNGIFFRCAWLASVQSVGASSDHRFHCRYSRDDDDDDEQQVAVDWRNYAAVPDFVASQTTVGRANTASYCRCCCCYCWHLRTYLRNCGCRVLSLFL